MIYTLYAMAMWILFKIYLLWLSYNGVLLYSSATYAAIQYMTLQTHCSFKEL